MCFPDAADVWRSNAGISYMLYHDQAARSCVSISLFVSFQRFLIVGRSDRKDRKGDQNAQPQG